MRVLTTLAVAAFAVALPSVASADCGRAKAAYEAKWKSKLSATSDHCARAYWFIRSAPQLKFVAAACSWEGARAWHMQQIDAKVAWLVQQSKANKCKRRY